MSTESVPSHSLLNRRAIFVPCGAAALLALFVLALYARLLLTNRVLASGDIFLYFYPYRDYGAAVLRSGQMPLWNPYIFLGAPFLANPQAAVLYPLHWPLLWLSVTKQIYWSAALHTWLLGLGLYFLLRHWKLSAWASLLGGVVLAGSGFYGGMIGHSNQMEGAAWLPWAVLILDFRFWILDSPSSKIQNLKSKIPAIILFATVVTLMLLAGHTQTAYINLFGLGIWTIWPTLTRLRGLKVQALPTAVVASGARLLIYGLGALLGVLLSAAQLLPTLEMNSLGLRHGGLSYGEASSFSLKVLRLPFTLLPTYGFADLGVVFGTSGYTEFVAYIGLFGLLLALIGAWQGRGAARTFGLLFAGVGLFLAVGRWNPIYFLLYKLVPGFNLFRTPARWMMLYTVGMAVLAGVGGDYLFGKIQRLGIGDWRLGWVNTNLIANRLSPILKSAWFFPLICLVLTSLDLLLAERALPHTQTTAPPAVYDVRTAPAYLLTDPVRATVGPAAAGRFLSMSPIGFDPGDATDFRRIFSESKPPQLDARAFEQFVIALKAQEILAPNLSLLWRVPAVDGYDGGVLPLQRYIDWLTLLIPPDKLVPDGRLSEQLKAMPRPDLLGMLNVQYVMTDKVRDLWFKDIYYDREIGVHLPASGPNRAQVEVPQTFEATHIGLIGYVDGRVQDLQRLQRQNIPVATVMVHRFGGATTQVTVTAGGQVGADLADGALDSSMAASSGVPVAYRDVDGQHQEYMAQLALPQPMQPVSITIQRLDTSVDVVVQAMTLIDARTGMFTPLLPSDHGRFRLVHSGDVKLYENLDVRPRAYLAYHVLEAKTPTAALDLLRTGQAATGQSSVVEGLAAFTSHAAATDQVQMLAYAPESVKIQTRNAERALLVLSDSAYPGWGATVDGVATPIYTTNYLFRGVPLSPGEHTVIFTYRPTSWQHGLVISGLSALFCLLLLGQTWRRK